MTDLHNYGALFVDDEKKERKLFGRLLENKLKTFKASSFETAEKILKDNYDEIGVIIADHRIPGNIWGLEFLRTCSEKYPEIVRILTTAHSDHNLAIEALNSGLLYKYILKPWNEDIFSQIILRASDYFVLQKERNFLAKERIATLQKIVLTDTLRHIAALALGLSNHINNSVAAFKKFTSLVPANLFASDPDVSDIEFKKVISAAAKKNDMFFGLIKDIGNTVVKPNTKFEPYDLIKILEKAAAEPEIRDELDITFNIKPDMDNISGDKIILKNLVHELIEYFIDIRAEKISIEVDKTILFGETEGIKITLIGSGCDNDKKKRNIWKLLPALFAVYHHAGEIDVKRSTIEVYLPIDPDLVKEKVDNTTDKIDTFFTQFEAIKYYETWLSIIR